MVQSLSHVQLLTSPWTAARQAPLSYTISLSLNKVMSIVLAMLSNHLTLCLLLSPAFDLLSIRVFSSESAICIRWPKFCSFSIIPSSEYSEFISFRIGRVVLLTVRGILKCHLSSTTIRKHHSAFLMIQLTHFYTITGKTIVLTLQTCVTKVMSLLFNMLSRFVMGFPGGSVVDNLSAMQGN